MVKKTKYIVMGVSGCGKSTIGRLLSAALEVPFLEGDDFHPVENLKKMKQGQALSNDDREAWIQSLISSANSVDGPCVISCSALNETVRGWISSSLQDSFQFVALEGRRQALLERLQSRKDHFFPPHLLDSQLETYQTPKDGWVFDIELSPQQICDEIILKIQTGEVR